MPSWLALGFQDTSGFMMFQLTTLHDYAIVIMFPVIIFIFYIMCFFLFNSMYYKFLSESTFVETVWSIIPAFFLIALVIPSMKILYSMEDLNACSTEHVIVAHQWYWTYYCKYLSGLVLGSSGSSVLSLQPNVMNEGEDITMVGEIYGSTPRLLEPDSDLVLPTHKSVHLLITSTDVVHSYSVPGMALKVDAVPGRINQLFFVPIRLGVFYGQCSEICGSNHSFMPVSVHVVDENSYLSMAYDSILGCEVE